MSCSILERCDFHSEGLFSVGNKIFCILTCHQICFCGIFSAFEVTLIVKFQAFHLH